MVAALEAVSAPEATDSRPAQEALERGSAVSGPAVSRIVQTIALSSSSLLDGTYDGRERPGANLSRQVGRLPYEDGRGVLTTVHELRGEREEALFPGAEFLVITRGAAEVVLALARHEFGQEDAAYQAGLRRARWQATVRDMEWQDMRVLGIAWRALEALPERLTEEIERELALVALVGVREHEHLPPATERSIARRIALQVLFELDCTEHEGEEVLAARIAAQGARGKQASYVRRLVRQVREQLVYLDGMLLRFAIDWPPEQLAIVDRNILRMAILEFSITRSAPVAVVINEAIELARLFSGEKSFDFINGVLGAIADEDAVGAAGQEAAADEEAPDAGKRGDSSGREAARDTPGEDLRAGEAPVT